MDDVPNDDDINEMLAQMHDITKLEIEQCRELLSESDWDLELAISRHFQDGHHHHHHHQVDDEPEPETPMSSWPLLRSSVAPIYAIARMVSEYASRACLNYPILQQLCEYFSTPVRFVSGFFRVVATFIWSLFFANDAEPTDEYQGFDSRIDPVDDVLGFISDFVQKYGHTVPSFYHGSFGQVTRDCVKEARCLLIYLHDNRSLVCDKVCREILCNRDVITFIDSQRLLFWACSIDRLEGFKVFQNESVRGCPFFAVYLPQHGRMEPFARFSNVENEQSFRRKVDGIINNTQHLMAVEIERRNRIVESVHIRREQDENFQRSLEADKLKAQKRAEEERLNRERIERDRQLTLELENLRSLAAEEVKEIQEPGLDRKQVVSLAIRVPDGTCLRRRFLQTDPVKHLCTYLRSNVQVPAQYDLYTNFPKKLLLEVRVGKTLQPGDLSLHDIGLTSSQGLFIHDIDA